MSNPTAALAQDHLHISSAAEPEVDLKKQKLHRWIARRYAWDERRRKRDRRPCLITLLRLNQLERFFAYSYGRHLPDDDSGRDDLLVVAHHLAQLGALERHLPAWARLWAPWLPEADCAALIARVLSKPLRWTADRLGWRIGLTDATRTLLKITTIGGIGCSKVQRAERREVRDAVAHRERRKLKASGRNRPPPLSAAKPWEAEGISRATWYRRRARETVRQNPSAAERATTLRTPRVSPTVVRFTSRHLIRFTKPSATPQPTRKAFLGAHFLSGRDRGKALCA